jgi:hypothetical protein
MFAAYFDESSYTETAKSKYYVIGGYIGSFSEWARLEKPWRKLLPSGVKAFHATDLDGAHKEFKYLKGRQLERASLQCEFAELTKRYGLQGLTVSVSLTHHRNAELPFAKGQEHMNVPHMMAFRAFVQFAAQLNLQYHPRETLAFVCSDGPYAGRMLDLFNQFKRHISQPWIRVLGSFSSHSMRESPQLQVADQLAYETLRFREDGKARVPLGILRADHQTLDYDLAERFYDKLTFLVREHNEKVDVSLDKPESLI